jgi:hypothetical protein
MIVTYNKQNKHIIPCAGGMKIVTLEEGPQEVANSDWLSARSYVLDMIESGAIGEEWVKKGKEDKATNKNESIPDPDDLSIVLCPATICDKNRTEARKLVFSCKHIPTLCAWMRLENYRPDILVLITERLIEVDYINKDEWIKEREVRVEAAVGKKR